MNQRKFLTSWHLTTPPISLSIHRQEEFTSNAKDTFDQRTSVNWLLLKDSILVAISGSYSTDEAQQIVDGLNDMVLSMLLKRSQQNG